MHLSVCLNGQITCLLISVGLVPLTWQNHDYILALSRLQTKRLQQLLGVAPAALPPPPNQTLAEAGSSAEFDAFVRLAAAGGFGMQLLDPGTLCGRDSLPLRAGIPGPARAGESSVDAALRSACDAGSLEAARALLAAGADVGARGRRRCTPLHCAARCGNTNIIQELLAAGADVEARDATGGTPLAWASSHDKAEAVEALAAAGAEVEACNALGMTPLILAAEYGSCEAVAALLAAGADPLNRGGGEIIALHTACRLAVHSGRHAAAARALLGVEAGVRQEMLAARDARQGAASLHYAAFAGAVQGIKILVSAGADVNVSDAQGRRPLHLAAAAEREELSARAIQALVAAGADLEAKYEHGFTPFLAAAEAGNIPAIRALAAAGADVAVRDFGGRSALDIAAVHQRWPMSRRPVVRALVEAGAPRGRSQPGSARQRQQGQN